MFFTFLCSHSPSPGGETEKEEKETKSKGECTPPSPVSHVSSCWDFSLDGLVLNFTSYHSCINQRHCG